jgi:hypothetical protein
MASGLTAAALLDVWERGLTRRPLECALDLMAAAHPETPPGEWAALPIGQRDAQLMALRESLFGSRLVCLAVCPQCGEKLEISLDLEQFITLSVEADPSNPNRLSTDGCEIEFRLPNSRDMLSIADQPDPSRARRALFERCVQQASRGTQPIASADVPDTLVDAVASQMALLDPRADIQIALSCPACDQQWSAPFDIVSYLWSEINTWAIRILREVHQLASAYGWREADILSLSPLRRQFYLEQIG